MMMAREERCSRGAGSLAIRGEHFSSIVGFDELFNGFVATRTVRVDRESRGESIRMKRRYIFSSLARRWSQ